MCLTETLKVGEGYVVDGFYPATIIEKDDTYHLAYNGVELPIRSIATAPDGSKAALKLGEKGTKKGVAIVPSPL